ncbi:hypothetical protein TNCV_3185131 [Trichonephila clavipes]|nr:hypothetical protein TNCV_3185131 [Trichonephila clavipes]
MAEELRSKNRQEVENIHSSVPMVLLVLRPVRATVITRRLGKWSRTEVRTLARFLWAKNAFPSNILRQIVEVYGGEAMNIQQVAKWCRSSLEGGREQKENYNMEASGVS